jgi:hypothetical protein
MYFSPSPSVSSLFRTAVTCAYTTSHSPVAVACVVVYSIFRTRLIFPTYFVLPYLFIVFADSTNLHDSASPPSASLPVRLLSLRALTRNIGTPRPRPRLIGRGKYLSIVISIRCARSLLSCSTSSPIFNIKVLRSCRLRNKTIRSPNSYTAIGIIFPGLSCLHS